MNTHQKIIVYIFRGLGILVILYAVAAFFAMMLFIGWEAVRMFARPVAVFGVAGLILFFAAKPLSRIITAGLEKKEDGEAKKID